MLRRNDRSKNPFRTTRVPAITLIEVLVVIAIIVLLVAMLIPSLNAARERVRRVICANNLRQWGTAVQAYRDENFDYLPTEGSYWNLDNPHAWFNALPPYLDLPSYRDLEGAGDAIRAHPNIHVWICPSKNLSSAYKSSTGANQFHYGMNQVLDGMGNAPNGSRDTPGFPEEGDKPLPGRRFSANPTTVFMFDIHGNSPAGSPRSVATAFHKDYANVLYLSGGVAHFRKNDFYTGGDYRSGVIVWTHPELYWGYRPPMD